MLLILLLSLLLTPIISYTRVTELINTTPKFPIILMHGILSNQEKMSDLQLFLETSFNLNVIVPEIGNGILNSINVPLNIQGEMLCEELNNNDLLKNGFNFIGVSQGGILGRYYIERCGKYQVNNFITLVSPHGGIYIEKIAKMFNMYSKSMQEHYSFISYWRDPFNYMKYIDSILLARLNNEVNSESYNENKARFTSLNNFIMVYSPSDDILHPPESGKFSTYDINSLNTISIEKTHMYDNLGLNELNNSNKIHIYATNCTHSQHKDYICFKQLYNMFEEFCYN